MTTATGRRESTRWTRRAWFAVGFIPIGFVLSMLIGEGLFATLGYASEDTDVPLGAIARFGDHALMALSALQARFRDGAKLRLAL